MQEFFLVVKPVSFCWDVFWMYWYIIWCICPFKWKETVEMVKNSGVSKGFFQEEI